jgi:hypothetical protein
VAGKLAGNSLRIKIFLKTWEQRRIFRFSNFPEKRRLVMSNPGRVGGWRLFSNALETKGIFNGPGEWRQPTRACHHFPFFRKDTKAAIARTASDNGLRPQKFPVALNEWCHWPP